MINLEKMAEKYRYAGYSERNADARVCQDVVLKAIARSNLGRNVTIKGGVVMRSITGNVRRATEDLDLGVHANMEIEQKTYCFDVCMDEEGASLLINSCEQIFAEKLRSLLRFGPLSTRYKDIFDFCYIKDHVDMLRLADCIKVYIIDEPSMREKDMKDVL